MNIHELKTWPTFFQDIISEKKTFEIRNRGRERDFQVGDVLLLKEWDPETEEYTGRETKRKVTYITDLSALGLSDRFGMSIAVFPEERFESVPDEAYFDRNQASQVIAKLALKLGYRAGIRNRDEEWAILYVDMPTGQVSWHIPFRELVDGLPDYADEWDGHNLQQKRERLSMFLKGEEEPGAS